MAGVPDSALPKLAGFPGGVNNVAPEHDLPLTTARELVNQDLRGGSKKARRRAGYTQVVDARCHSPAELLTENGPTLLLVRDGDLVAYDRDLASLGTVRSALGARFVSYAEVNGSLYWSNGEQFRRVRGDDLADTVGWPACPTVPQATAIAGGSLAAGTYRVAMTCFDAEGRESGADGVEEVVVSDGQAIYLSGFGEPPEGAVRLRLYVTPPDGEVLYAVTDILPIATNATVASLNAQGKVLETLWLYPMPPMDLLRAWNGRLLGAKNNVLRWSAALRHGLTHADSYMQFGLDITLLEPIGDGGDGAGVWVADHKNTYWLSGPAPDQWRRQIRYDQPAVPGTALRVPGTLLGLQITEPVLYWLAANGVFCAGLPGGQLVQLTEGRLALPGGERGASLFREHEGLRQIITAWLSSGSNGLAITDRASATVTRHP